MGHTSVASLNHMHNGSNPVITIDQMAWVFEQLSDDVSLKVLAGELKVDVSTLTRRLNRAEREGFAAFRGKRSEYQNCADK